MAAYWQNEEDIRKWVGSRGTADVAAKELMDIIQKIDHENVTINQVTPSAVPEENSIVETCKTIIEHPENEEAAKVLLGILASRGLAGNLKKVTETSEGVKMEKQAQNAPSQSRQRNGWVRGMRNKWNRVVDGFNDGTPWRIDRDKFYNFTHYYTDAISFDEDPKKVYSGEALWRMYIMDKFYADYQDKDGKVVGGYINDRFHRFPTAGTPAVPDTDRHGGNSMELANGERTRKPRPHQYSVERRLEEARGNKLDDLEVAASAGFEKVVKIASTLDPERNDDRVYSILKDTIEMREAGIDYKTMLNAIADHYGASVLGISQIDKFGQDMVKKHQKVAYHMVKADVAPLTIAEVIKNQADFIGHNISIPDGTVVLDAKGNKYSLASESGEPAKVQVDRNTPNQFIVTWGEGVGANTQVTFANTNIGVSVATPVQETFAELEGQKMTPKNIDRIQDAVEAETGEAIGGTAGQPTFGITEMQPAQ